MIFMCSVQYLKMYTWYLPREIHIFERNHTWQTYLRLVTATTRLAMALDQETKDFRTGLVVLDRIQRVPGTLASNGGRMQGSYFKWSGKWLKTSKYIIEIANRLIVATLKYLQFVLWKGYS